MYEGSRLRMRICKRKTCLDANTWKTPTRAYAMSPTRGCRNQTNIGQTLVVNMRSPNALNTEQWEECQIERREVVVSNKLMIVEDCKSHQHRRRRRPAHEPVWFGVQSANGALPQPSPTSLHLPSTTLGIIQSHQTLLASHGHFLKLKAKSRLRYLLVMS